jgi:hypothetical protein
VYCVSSPSAQQDLVTNQIKNRFGIRPELGVSVQVSLHQHALAALPATALFQE